MFYNGYILPIFDYCCTIWGKGNTKYVQKINKLQKRIAKLILNRPVKSHSSDLLKELHWLSFSDRCKYHTTLLVYKIFNNMAPIYMSELIAFCQNDSYSLRSTSRKDLVLQTKPRTNLYKDSFSYYSFKVWNDISMELRLLKIQSFKRNYKNYLYNKM
jgi:hypothetical protein